MVRLGVRRCWVLGVLLACSCQEAEEDGRSDVIRWFVFEQLEPPSAELLEGVEDIWGLELSESDSAHGAVSIFLAEPVTGWSFSGGWSCTPYVHIEQHDAETVAHEIGHAYGLEHVDEPGNLMNPDRSGVEVNAEQLDYVRWSLWLTEERCR